MQEVHVDVELDEVSEPAFESESYKALPRQDQHFKTIAVKKHIA